MTNKPHPQSLAPTSCAPCPSLLDTTSQLVARMKVVKDFGRHIKEIEKRHVSGRVPEIRIPVRKRDSPDFSEFRRLSLASTDIEENPASGDLSTDIG
ncbi:uncharacterized protein MEPE_06848 [Melanopsichium pennsylvanicum]|uniref:Uncharacterized protein n=1 Tax=Melanopsichium pennsylvanicum TaxID=63383 RepID=A0AAJ4XU02_9BASI|nr:uncharacterized protein MEPE_06848 [Melanopsichium pennsylvanicum]